ncbi:MAG: diguanylate cyclase, partial [Anaerolineaceae bacterium]|nr:diguanylate cyclase [Anaerolineaceae bacterium]
MNQTIDSSVLVVDDDPALLAMLTSALTDHHFQCTAASSLQQARFALEQEEIDLVVADVALADGSGLDLLKSIRCTHPSLPVIVITGFPSAHLAGDALRLGAFDLLEKPFDINSLVQVLSEAAATRQRQVANLREMLSMINQPAVFVHRDGRLLTANRKWEELAGPGSSDSSINCVVAPDSAVTICDLLAGTDEANRATARVNLICPKGTVPTDITGVKMQERRDQPGGYLLMAAPRSATESENGSHGETKDLDPLTGCLTHGAFFRALETMRCEARRRSLSVRLMMIDVDDLHAINQTQGYEMADRVLENLANTIRRLVRNEDLVGRYGGDEFIVALKESDIEGAMAVGERICMAVVGAAYNINGVALSIRITVGVTDCPAGYTSTNRELAEQARLAIAWGRRNNSGPVVRFSQKMREERPGPAVDQEQIERLTREFTVANEELKAAYVESARALVAAVEAKDPYTRRHGDAVAAYVVQLAIEMGLPEPLQRSVRYAALLHDVGKIGIPDHILTKPGSLTAEEFALVKQHPTIGANIVSQISFMRREVPIVQHHHEN